VGRPDRAAEADPRYGSWLFLRIETTAADASVERRYDTWPSWWSDDGISGPWRTSLQAEVAHRAERWRPPWTDLLDPDVAYQVG
jgi:hypothetical protein